MKFAFSTLACPSWSIQEVVDNAVTMGYDAIELRLLDGEVIDPVRDAEKVVDAVSLSRVNSIEVCALDTSCRFNFADAAERTRNVAELQQWISLAQQVRVPILRVFGGGRKEDAKSNEEEENGWLAASLRSVAQQAEEAGVTIAIETHDDFSSARRIAKILKMIESPAVGALWDSHHPYRFGESADDVIAALAGHIVHVHVKDAFRIPETSNWKLVLLGEGEVPVQEQLLHLYQHGYNGYISVEWEKRWHLELSNPEIALPEHIAWLKRFEQALPQV